MAPIRTCVGCRRRAEQSELLRVVAVDAPTREPSSQGSHPVRRLRPDSRAVLPGRGAWLHPEPACFDQAVRRRAFTRALRLSAQVDAEDVRSYLAGLGEVGCDTSQPEKHNLPRATRLVGSAPHPSETESGFDADEHPMSTQR